MMLLQTTAHGDNETTFDSLVSQVRISPRPRNPRFSFEDSSDLDCAPQLRCSNNAVTGCTTIGCLGQNSISSMSIFAQGSLVFRETGSWINVLDKDVNLTEV
jgi:hypothetical protein